MNALDKTNNVRKALECCRYCERYRPVCNECPYDNNGCKSALYDDVLEVIDGFKAELKKRTTKSSAAGPTFIALTIYGSGEKIAVKLDDISYICERKDGDGSSIYLKALDGARVSVTESIIDILEKVSRGE